MDSLEYKYRKDQLSGEELQELKQQINAMSDMELEQRMRDVWMNEDIEVSAVEDERIARIRGNIERSLAGKPGRMSVLVRWGQIAAAVLLPVFMVLSFYLYHESNLQVSQEMIVSTNQGERASIVLPDGTKVMLNSESRLGYLPKNYNKKEREISFVGEGYFQVHRNEEVPFTIQAAGLQVNVLGTTFNLSVRDANNKAELFLEEGSVKLLSTKNNKSVILQPHEKAILDRQTGNITVVSNADTEYTSAWRRGEMVFRNTPLTDVIRSVEQNYNVTIKVGCESCLDETFTGTLPLTNLNEVLEVLELSYNIEAVIVDKEIYLK